MAEIDPRVGEKNEDGSVKRWPQTDVKGQPYGPGPTVMGWGARGFVVLPVGDHSEALKRLQAECPPETDTQNRYESRSKPKGTGDASTPAAE